MSECRHNLNRRYVGPTGRKGFMILVDECSRCLRILRTVRDISWPEYCWVRRWNARQEPRDE